LALGGAPSPGGIERSSARGCHRAAARPASARSGPRAAMSLKRNALLLVLAYEGWRSARAAPQLTVAAPAQWFLGRPTRVQLQLRQGLARDVLLELALTAPLQFTM